MKALLLPTKLLTKDSPRFICSLFWNWRIHRNDYFGGFELICLYVCLDTPSCAVGHAQHDNRGGYDSHRSHDVAGTTITAAAWNVRFCAAQENTEHTVGKHPCHRIDSVREVTQTLRLIPMFLTNDDDHHHGRDVHETGTCRGIGYQLYEATSFDLFDSICASRWSGFRSYVVHVPLVPCHMVREVRLKN